MLQISEIRKSLQPRYWHIPLTAVLAAGLFAGAHYLYFVKTGIEPTTDNKWYVKPLFCLIFFVPILAGSISTRYAGGLLRIKRIAAGAVCGLVIGILYSLTAFGMERSWDLQQISLLVPMIWRSFAMAIFSTIGAIITEIRTPVPDLK